MQEVFLICGYGVPKDITRDENYRFYLKLAFNQIWDAVTERAIEKPVIVFSGGKTDMWKPYKRDEAKEMMRYFKELCAQDVTKTTTKNWKLLAESKAISTLENLLFTKELLQKNNIPDCPTTIICEYTRTNRLQKLGKLILGKNCKVIGIDFDQSANRYLDPEFIKQKEATVIKYDLLAIKDPEEMKKHHQLYAEKIAYLRKAGPKAHVEAVGKWWKEKLAEAYGEVK